PGSRGVTQDSSAHTENMDQDRTHLIADRFLGPGFKETKNIVTASGHYNKDIMGQVEDDIAKHLNDKTKKSPEPPGVTFTLVVTVKWADPQGAAGLAKYIAEHADSAGYYNTPERLQELQTYLAGCSAKLKIIESVKYEVSG